MRLLPFLAAALLAATACAQTPVVISAAPDHGDSGVDPATTEIRVEFSQDMSPAAQAICGSGPTFPRLGAIRWQSPRILVIPVTLEPDHAYDLSINCPSAKGFKGVNGEPAEITPISFRTGKPGAKAPPGPSKLANAAAVTILRDAIESRYSYRDRVIKDWQSLIDPEVDALIASPSRAAFARRLSRVLSAARDVHMWIAAGDARFSVARLNIVPNANAELLAKCIPNFKPHNRIVLSGRFDDGIGYIAINSLPGNPEPLEPAHDAFKSLKDAPAIILDLRANGGGDENAARKLAAHFTAGTVTYSKCRIRDPDKPAGWSELMDRKITGRAEYKGKLIVLVGPGCVSSTESFILMLRHGAGATLIGAPTFGSSGNPKPHDLGNGVTVFLPSWKDFEPDGTLLEGRGVQPDISVTFTGKDRDDVLEAALDRLRRPE